jgi:hypothetical protein
VVHDRSPTSVFLEAEYEKIGSLLGHGGYYPKYYWREAEQRVAQAKQLLASHLTRWDASVALLKNKALAFCAQHPDFEPLLQKILVAEDFSKPPREHYFTLHLDSGYSKDGQFTSIYSPSADLIRHWLRVCYSAQEWADNIIQSLYSFYQELSQNPQAPFRIYVNPLAMRAKIVEFAEQNCFYHLNNTGSVVVIDSQRDMIQKLLRLKHGMDLLYIDPENIEAPPGIALFDVKFGTGREAEAREAAVIQNYEYMFSVFDSELTGRQGSIFTYALRLMFHVPDSNIHNLISLFRGEDFRKYIGQLSEVERQFFEKEFLSPQYKANREQILAKLNIIVSNKTLRRIFANKRKVFDFHEVLSRPCVTLISTSRAQLQAQGCALFGRFMLSLVVDAITQRAHIPEEKRLHTFIYVDEGKDYGNDDAFERIIYECRKYGAGLIFCSQNMGQRWGNCRPPPSPPSSLRE